MIIMSLGCVAYAADGYTKAHAITVAEDSAKKIRITPVKYPLELDEEGFPVTIDGSYVADGEDYHFIITTIGGNAFDQTTKVRAYPTSRYLDIIEGVDFEFIEKTPDGKIVDKPYDPVSGYGVLSPDKDGVYTITSVNQDLTISTANLQSKSIAGVKDFLLNFFQFFINWMRWFFGLRF